MILLSLLCCMLLGVTIARPDLSSSVGSSQYADGQGGTFGTTYTAAGGPLAQPGRPIQQQQGSFYGQGFGGYNPLSAGGSQGFPSFQPFQSMQPFQSQFNGFPTGFPSIPFVPAPTFQPLQFAPMPPLLSPPQFNEALSQYVSSLQQQYANFNGGSFVYSTPDASAYAYSSLGPSDLYQQQQSQWDAWKNQAASAQPNHQQQYAPPNMAAATGFHGPSGIHQTASLNPENPKSPNIETRFDASATPGGYVGIQTSSFSSSSNINGVPTQHKGAITTVNENGKITTYKTES